MGRESAPPSQQAVSPCTLHNPISSSAVGCISLPASSASDYTLATIACSTQCRTLIITKTVAWVPRRYSSHSLVSGAHLSHALSRITTQCESPWFPLLLWLRYDHVAISRNLNPMVSSLFITVSASKNSNCIPADDTPTQLVQKKDIIKNRILSLEYTHSRLLAINSR